MGIGIDELLERIVTAIPPPSGNPAAPLKALLFDSWYDPYRGVTSLVRIVDGQLRPRMKIRAMATGLEAETALTVPGAHLSLGEALVVASRACEVAAGSEGVVLTTGTDTLEELAVLCAMLHDGDAPIVGRCRGLVNVR